MIIGIGVDIVLIERVETLLALKKDSFLTKVFTPVERQSGDKLPPEKQAAFYAKRYAVKEAVSKALGTGIGSRAGWQDIETVRLPSGAPTVRLSGKAAKTADELAQGNGYRVHVSLSDDTFAEAFVILESL